MQARRAVYNLLDDEQRKAFHLSVAELRLQAEAEALGYETPVNLASTDPSLPLHIRIAMARRVQRETEALRMEEEVSAAYHVSREAARCRMRRADTLACQARIVSLAQTRVPELLYQRPAHVQCTCPGCGRHRRFVSAKPGAGEQAARVMRLRQRPSRSAQDAVEEAERELRLNRGLASGREGTALSERPLVGGPSAAPSGSAAGDMTRYVKRSTQVLLRGTQVLRRLAAPGWRKHEAATQTLMQGIRPTAGWLAEGNRHPRVVSACDDEFDARTERPPSSQRCAHDDG